MTYTYPRPQEVYSDTLFLMAETVQSNNFSDYMIEYKQGKKLKTFKIQHEFLMAASSRGIVQLLSKPGAFNNKAFYRIPLKIQLTLC